MRRLAWLTALVVSARSQVDELQTLIGNHATTSEPITKSTNSAHNYCHNTLPATHFEGVQTSGCGSTTANNGVCEIQSTQGGNECSVQELTCENGSFNPPRAFCKSNQCGAWESPEDSFYSDFGKIAQVSDAQSYLFTDENDTKKVKLTVYVNERWLNSDNFASVEIYLRPDDESSTRAFPSTARNGPGWTSSRDDSAAGRRLQDEIPAYLKQDGSPCIVAFQLEVTWAQWIQNLNTAPVSVGEDSLNVNQVVVQAVTTQEYVQWDRRLPAATDKELQQDVTKVMNVVIRYPHTLEARTPVFTLTDEKHVDVQITSLRIDEVEWGQVTSPGSPLAAERTRFNLVLEMESQVQAPFRLENISKVNVPEDMLFSQTAGHDVRLVEDCEVRENDDGTFTSPNGRFFQADDLPVQICSQKWSITRSVAFVNRCEIPADFGFRWDMACVPGIYAADAAEENTDCPLAAAGEIFEVTLSDLVDSLDVLWVCPHMISEHPVHTTFRTYRNEPGGQVQEVFVADETLYADIDLETNWGFLAIESAEIQSLKISYDRSFDPALWREAPADKCGRGQAVANNKCEYVLKRTRNGTTSLTEIAREVAFGGEEGNGTELQYDADAATGNGCYNDGAELPQFDTDTACRAAGHHWGKLNNRHHYKLAFNFQLLSGVFPEPYASCDAMSWSQDGGYDGEIKAGANGEVNYQAQEYLGGLGLASGAQRDCEFTQGNMKFLAEVMVTYSSGARRRMLVQSPLHHAGVEARTDIVIESRAEAAYEEALNVAALQQISSFTHRGTQPHSAQREQPVEQVLAQENEPGPPSGGAWEVSTGVSIGAAALICLLLLICHLHQKERKRHKRFDDSMEGLLQKYTARSDDPEQCVEEERPSGRVRIVEPEKPQGEKIEEHDDDTIMDQGIMVQHPQPTAIAAFGEDAPDPDDLPPVPTHRRPRTDDTVSLGVPPTQRASSTAPNSTRGTILHAVHSIQSDPSYRHPSVQSVTSARSFASNTSQDPYQPPISRNGTEGSCALSSGTVRSHITSKRGSRTDERDPTVTMSTCTDYVIDRGPGPESPPV